MSEINQSYGFHRCLPCRLRINAGLGGGGQDGGVADEGRRTLDHGVLLLLVLVHQELRLAGVSKQERPVYMGAFIKTQALFLLNQFPKSFILKRLNFNYVLLKPQYQSAAQWQGGSFSKTGLD